MDPVNDRPDTARLIATWDGTGYERHSSHQRQWGSGLIPFLQALPSALRQDFRNAVVNNMRAQCRRPDGTYVEQFRRINVWAQRPGDTG